MLDLPWWRQPRVVESGIDRSAEDDGAAIGACPVNDTLGSSML